MKTQLIVTVGGSHQPILRSIEQNSPDFVHFMCSDDSGRTKGSYYQVTGEGKVLKSRSDVPQPDLLNIVTLAGLTRAQFEVHRIEHFDNLNDCYLKSLELIELIHNEHREALVIADYTGGTKSMTAGLAAAALDDGQCEIRLVAGFRQDLHKVADQTEFVRPVQVWDAQALRRMRAVRELISRYDYAGASKLLQEASRRFGSDGTVEKLQRWITFCRAFDAWDKFDHTTALQLLGPCRGVFDDYKRFLAMLVERKGHGFELVEDLLLNAERRASQERYDDAIGRLYRALELTAQIWLRERHEIDTSRVEILQIPEQMRPRVGHDADEKGMVKIALLLAWDVIGAMTTDPLGQLFAAKRPSILHFLRVRNDSLFAHGLSPISRNDYHAHSKLISSFILEGIEAAVGQSRKRRVALQQLPMIWD